MAKMLNVRTIEVGNEKIAEKLKGKINKKFGKKLEGGVTLMPQESGACELTYATTDDRVFTGIGGLILNTVGPVKTKKVERKKK